MAHGCSSDEQTGRQLEVEKHGNHHIDSRKQTGRGQNQCFCPSFAEKKQRQDKKAGRGHIEPTKLTPTI